MVEDRKLVNMLRHGDKEGLRRIYEKYKNDLISVAIPLIGNVGEAEDVLHDVFVSFAKGARHFRLYGSLKGYLMTCIVNLAHDKIRAKKRHAGGIENLEDISSNIAEPAKLAIGDEELSKVDEALGLLPLEQREVIVLHLQGGLKFTEIARLQNISVNTIRSRHRYGLSRLRLLLDGEVIQ